MINRIVEEIYKALDAELYIVALCAALTLPDICGKAEFPNDKCANRYKNWYETHIGRTEKSPAASDDMPYLSGEVVYSLRCSLLHQGNPNVDNSKTKINQFELMSGAEIYADSTSVTTYSNGTIIRSCKIHIKSLCKKLCCVAQHYFEQNKDKFNFFNYTIVDMNKILPLMFPRTKRD